MKNALKMKSWSPYVVGAGIGILSWFTFLTAGNALGISTAFESTAAIAEQQILPQMAATNPFFEKKVPKIDWGWMLVVGVFVGALISSRISGLVQGFPVIVVLRRFHRFGHSVLVRLP